MERSLFFSSNSHSQNFPTNSRSQFKVEIDETDFNYLKQDEVMTAVKSITFDNKYNTFVHKNNSPHLIVVHIPFEGEYEENNSYFDIKKDINYSPNLNSEKDYLYFYFIFFIILYTIFIFFQKTGVD